MIPDLQLIGIAALAFVSTSFDNLAVLTLLFSTRELRPARIAAGYLGISGVVTGLAWTGAILAELTIAESLGYLGWIPIGLGLRGIWMLRKPTRQASVPTSLPGGEMAALALILATSADNLLVSFSLFGHASDAADPILFNTLVACSLVWCAFAFWLARRSPLATALQSTVPPLLPFLLIAIGAYLLIGMQPEPPVLRSQLRIPFDRGVVPPGEPEAQVPADPAWPGGGTGWA